MKWVEEEEEEEEEERYLHFGKQARIEVSVFCTVRLCCMLGNIMDGQIVMRNKLLLQQNIVLKIYLSLGI
jgi:hypothetical protein